MPRITLASSITSVCPAGGGVVDGATVREALEALCGQHPALRSYLLDDQGAVRKHMSIFLDGAPIADRQRQSDPVRPDSEIFVLQALSGG